MRYGTDYVTINGASPAARPHLSGTIFPDDGSKPFLMQVNGVQLADPEVDGITTNSSGQGRQVPYGRVYSGGLDYRPAAVVANADGKDRQCGLRRSPAAIRRIPICRTPYSLRRRL